jgi:transcription antiterminator, bglG family
MASSRYRQLETDLTEINKKIRRIRMKKILFLIMLVVMGNTFSANNQAQQSVPARTVEDENMEIKKALISRLQSFFFTIVNAGIQDNEKKLEKETYNRLFKKDYIISNALKHEIVDKYIRSISRITARETPLRFDVKQIDYVSDDEVEVIYDIKSKNLKDVPDMLDLDEETERQIMEKAKFSSVSELEKVMKNKGNEPLKRNYYSIAITKRIKMFEAEAKKITEEEVIIENVPATLKKVNGKWEVDSLEKTMKGIK